MHIEPFGLERWFAEYEHEAEIMLSESGIRSLEASKFDLDPGALGYVIPTNGDPAFRATVGARYGRSADEVLFTCGAQEANVLAFLALMEDEAPEADARPEGDERPDEEALGLFRPSLGAFRPSSDAKRASSSTERTTADEPHAVVITPTYQALVSIPEALGSVTRVELEPPDWRLDVSKVADAMQPSTRAIVLANPNNPTGRYHSRETIEALYDLAEEHDAFLLCDEVYRLLADDPQPPAASLGERSISTSSVTKAHGAAGLRFGWIAGPAELLEDAWRWKDYTTISPSVIGQHVARQVLEDEDEILAANRALAAAHRDRVGEWVEAHGLEWFEPVGVTGFVTVPDGFDAGIEFCTTVVEEADVVLAPGEVFGRPGYFRIGFGVETEELEEGLARVGGVIEES